MLHCYSNLNASASPWQDASACFGGEPYLGYTPSRRASRRPRRRGGWGAAPRWPPCPGCSGPRRRRRWCCRPWWCTRNQCPAHPATPYRQPSACLVSNARIPSNMRLRLKISRPHPPSRNRKQGVEARQGCEGKRERPAAEGAAGARSARRAGTGGRAPWCCSPTCWRRGGGSRWGAGGGLGAARGVDWRGRRGGGGDGRREIAAAEWGSAEREVRAKPSFGARGRSGEPAPGWGLMDR